MNENLSHRPAPSTPEHSPIAKIIPLQREPSHHEAYGSIDYSNLPAEEIIAQFVHTYTRPSHLKLRGATLAEHIDQKLTTGTDNPSTLTGRLAGIYKHSQDVLMSDEIYEHKNTSDETFHALVDTLQNTKKERGIELQRRACMKLLALRSSLENDVTDYDQDWHAIARRLFD